MPELLTEYVVERFRRMTVAAVCTLALCTIPAGAWAQSVPAGLRACAAESDPGQRLDCYDREMKRLLAPAAQTARPTQPTPAAAAVPAAAAGPAAAPIASAPAPSSASTPTDAASGSGARASQSAMSPPPPARSAASVKEPPAARRSGVWRFFSGRGPSRVTARIVRVDRSPGTMVLHLDNGQVWRQIGRAPGGLGLRAGDEVTIAQHLGSFWLSSSHVSDMRVRQESR